MAGYIANGAVVGMWLEYESGTLVISSGTISFDGYTTPFPQTSIDIVLSDMDYVLFINGSITKGTTPAGIVIARYVSGNFDYSYRTANSPLDSVDIVDNITSAYSSEADYVYIKSSNEMYVTAPFVSDEMLSCLARVSDVSFIANGKIAALTAKLLITDNITVITKIKCRGRIYSESTLQFSIDIDRKRGERFSFRPDSDNVIEFEIERDCSLTTDSRIRLMVYADSQFEVYDCEMFGG